MMLALDVNGFLSTMYVFGDHLKNIHEEDQLLFY